MESNQMCFNKPSHDSDVHKSLRVISVREKMLSFLALPRASSAQRMLLELILRHCDSSRINSHSFKRMLHSVCSVSPSNHQDSWWIFNNFCLDRIWNYQLFDNGFFLCGVRCNAVIITAIRRRCWNFSRVEAGITFELPLIASQFLFLH